MSKSTSGGIGLFGWIIIMTVFYNLFIADDNEDKTKDAKTPVVVEQQVKGSSSATSLDESASKLISDAKDVAEEGLSLIKERLNSTQVNKTASESGVAVKPVEKETVIAEKEEPKEEKDFNTATVNDPYGKIENKY